MKFLNPVDASQYLMEKYRIKHSPRTLANKRSFGNGPRYRRVNSISVVYSDESLDEYAETILGKEFGNTAEETAARERAAAKWRESQAAA